MSGRSIVGLVAICLQVPAIARDFKSDLATKVAAAEAANQDVVAGQGGWLFWRGELRHLSLGQYWGDAAAAVSRASSPKNADPLPAILGFRDQLKKAGIDLLFVPVPGKAAIYPEMIVPGAVNSDSARVDAADAQFLGLLKQNGVDVLDLVPPFLEYRQDHPDQLLYSREDTHWSGYGIALASDLIAEKVKAEPWYGAVPKSKFTWKTAPVKVTGDLVQYMKDAKPGPEEIVLTAVKDANGATVQPSRQSPVLLIGDSHNLIYSIGKSGDEDMLAVSSGFPENLAARIGFAPDVVAGMGSGTSAPRISLFRRADNMAGKKIVIWCFTARDFTESLEGWRVNVPVIKTGQ